MRNPRLESVTYKIFDSIAIAASGTIVSEQIDLLGCEGYVGVFAEAVGSGIVSLSYRLGVYKDFYANPLGVVTYLLTGFTATAGYYWFNPPISRFIKFTATETGAANPLTLSIHVVIA